MSARISYLAAARLKDKAILASNFSTNISGRERSDIEAAFFAALQSEGSSTQGSSRKTKQVSAVGGKLYMMADSKGQLVFTSCIGDSTISDKIVWQMVEEFMQAIMSQHAETLMSVTPESLTRGSRKMMKDLMLKYDSPSGMVPDKTSEVRQKVEEVQGIMQDNVKKMLDQQTNVESLEEKSDGMSKQANQFLKQSVDLRRHMQWKALKMKILLGIVIAAVLAYVIYLIVEASK
jgi:hypothetical protein